MLYVEAPPLITCGESATLLGEGYITSTYSDDFNSWTSPTNPSSLWANVSTGGTTNSNCTGSPTTTSSCSGSTTGGDFLWFPQGSMVPRVAELYKCRCFLGELYSSNLKWRDKEVHDGPDQVNEGIFLQYNVQLGKDLLINQPPFSSNPIPYTNERTLFPQGMEILACPQYNTWDNILSLFLRCAWSKHSI